MENIDTEIVICGLCKSNLMREILGAVVCVPLSNDVQGKRPDGPISYLRNEPSGSQNPRGGLAVSVEPKAAL